MTAHERDLLGEAFEMGRQLLACQANGFAESGEIDHV